MSRHEEHMRKAFLDAAKEVIREEGVDGVSARKVGRKAGYSYATLYNYFSSREHLLAQCALDVLEECHQTLLALRSRLHETTHTPEERMVRYALAYFEFFSARPSAFDLAFLEPIRVDGERPGQSSMPRIARFLHDALGDTDIVQAHPERAELLFELIGSSLHGKLMYFLRRRKPAQKDAVRADIEHELNYLLKEQGEA